jgi:branched-subunit amino acid transport protein
VNHYALIVGMFLVTYIPRLLPFYALRRQPTGRLKRFLDALPVAAMAALVFPDAFSAVSSGPLPATFGLATAALVAWFVKGLLIPLLAAVGAVAVTLVMGL